MNRLSVIAVGCLTLAALTACGGGAGDPDVIDAASRVKGGFESMAAPGQAMSTQTAATGAAREAAAKALGVAPNTISIDKVEPVQWNDASLGCPDAGKVFVQAITPGLRIIVSSASGQRHEVHLDDAGRMVLCQTPTQ